MKRHITVTIVLCVTCSAMFFALGIIGTQQKWFGHGGYKKIPTNIPEAQRIIQIAEERWDFLESSRNYDSSQWESVAELYGQAGRIFLDNEELHLVTDCVFNGMAAAARSGDPKLLAEWTKLVKEWEQQIKIEQQINQGD